MSAASLPAYYSFISGAQVKPADASGEWTVRSPAKSDQAIGRCVYSYSQMDQVVEAANAGFLSWTQVHFEGRKKVLTSAFHRLFENQEVLTQILRTELGRSNADIQLEFTQLAKWMQQDDFVALDQGRGVTALLASYVWPIFYSMQFIFTNLLAGNALIIKPSEKATLSTLKLVEILCQDSLLVSALQVLVGEKEIGRRLACHEQIQTVIFMGSYENGIRVKQDTLSQVSKQVLLYLGAKNPILLLEDFDSTQIDKMVQDSLLTTGQQWRSASVIFVHDHLYSQFLERFHERAKQIKIGGLVDLDAVMGPLIDESMVDRYLKFSGISEREGAEVCMRGKLMQHSEKGYFVTPTIVSYESLTPEQMKKSVALQTEILSPHVSVIRYSDYDSLLEVTQQMQQGHGASIWGANAERMSHLSAALDFGSIQLNQSLLEWDPKASFQVRKKSGNHAFHGLALIQQLMNRKVIS